MGFPPSSILGFMLNMTQLEPIDIKNVLSSLITSIRLVKLPTGGTSQTFNGITWTVPDNIDIIQKPDLTSIHQVFKSGTEAAQALKEDASLQANFGAVELDASVAYSVDKTFTHDKQYMFFSWNSSLLFIHLEYGSIINRDGLGSYLKDIPPFDATKPESVGEYRDLFAAIGSHVITGVNYGATVQITAFAENKNESINTNFTAYIGTKYNGLTNGGKLEATIAADITKSDEYKSFSNSASDTVSVQGGEPKLALPLSTPQAPPLPTVPDGTLWSKFTEWSQSALTSPDIMRVSLTPLWIFCKFAGHEISARSKDIEDAYNHICNFPQTHQTKGTLKIDSDWGQIALSSPSASLALDTSQQISQDIKDHLTLTSTKLYFNRGDHVWADNVVIPFVITNDGSALTITTSHGSQMGNAKGRITANIGGENYVNDDVTDNGWNSKTVYQVKASKSIVA